MQYMADMRKQQLMAAAVRSGKQEWKLRAGL